MASAGCVLVTGGAGYIGSHTMVYLLENNYDVVVIDNLHNASMESVRVVEKLTGKKVICYKEDLLHMEEMRGIFKWHKFDYIIHFAGLKSVGESMQFPLMYYRNNIGATINLVELMREFNVRNLIFSSSCTVYGNSQYLPIDEKHPTGGCTNPYGRTKYFIEQFLMDIQRAEEGWNIVLLRYFNPVGAHESGMLGEDPNGIPNQLMPYVAQVAVGRREKLQVFGNDYSTPDGTCIRDYIHVVDLAKGHVLALNKLKENCNLKIYNLGTGQGYSVMDMIKAFEKACGKKIPYEVVGRRVGDAEVVYADPSLAEKELGWTAKLGLETMCNDLWRWQSMNPDGYGIGGDASASKDLSNESQKA